MGYRFTPIDFPDYADLTYKQLRPILMYQGKPPIGVFADLLRATLPRKKQREFDKMTAWCTVNRKQPSRRRFINWLNRAERPMAAVTQDTFGSVRPNLGAW